MTSEGSSQIFDVEIAEGQTDRWHTSCIEIPDTFYANAETTFTYKATRGRNFTADIVLDNVRLATYCPRKI